MNRLLYFFKKKSNRPIFIIITLYIIIYILTIPWRRKPTLLREINIGKIESIKLIKKAALLGDVPYYEIKTSSGNLIIYSDIWQVENIGLHHKIGGKARIQIYSNPGGAHNRGYFRSEGTNHTFYVGSYGLEENNE